LILAVLLRVLVSQTEPRIIVIDVSAPDAIYEDVSRALADDVVNGFSKAKVWTLRVDENEMPKGCRAGPCLGKVAQERRADIVVTLDAEQEGEGVPKISISAMRGTNGELLAALRYRAQPKGKPTKKFMEFVGNALKALRK